MERIFGLEKDNIAACSLGLDPDQWTIVYIAHSVMVVRDPEDIIEKCNCAELVFDEDDVRDAIQDGCIEVAMPENHILVGMRPLDGDENSPRKYGIVNILF
jgi:hypothetical protein